MASDVPREKRDESDAFPSEFSGESVNSTLEKLSILIAVVVNNDRFSKQTHSLNCTCRKIKPLANTDLY